MSTLTIEITEPRSSRPGCKPRKKRSNIKKAHKAHKPTKKHHNARPPKQKAAAPPKKIKKATPKAAAPQPRKAAPSRPAPTPRPAAAPKKRGLLRRFDDLFRKRDGGSLFRIKQAPYTNTPVHRLDDQITAAEISPAPTTAGFIGAAAPSEQPRMATVITLPPHPPVATGEPEPLSDLSGLTDAHVSKIEALNKKLAKLDNVFGYRYRVYCTASKETPYVMKRYELDCQKADTHPSYSDELSKYKPVGIGPKTRNKWFEKKHGMTWDFVERSEQGAIFVKAKEAARQREQANAKKTKRTQPATKAKTAPKAAPKAAAKKAAMPKAAARPKAAPKAATPKAAPKAATPKAAPKAAATPKATRRPSPSSTKPMSTPQPKNDPPKPTTSTSASNLDAADAKMDRLAALLEAAISKAA